MGENLVVIWVVNLVVVGGYGGDLHGHGHGHSHVHGRHQKEEEEASFVERLVHDNVDSDDSDTDTHGQPVDKDNDNHDFHHLRPQFQIRHQFQICCHSFVFRICVSTIFRPQSRG